LPVSRQSNLELTAFARSAGHSDITIDQFHEFVRDTESEPVAGILAGVAGTSLLERLKEIFSGRLRNADAGVFDRQD
jgi:hypothetical protein